jgi:hypothetical protein
MKGTKNQLSDLNRDRMSDSAPLYALIIVAGTLLVIGLVGYFMLRGIFA